MCLTSCACLCAQLGFAVPLHRWVWVAVGVMIGYNILFNIIIVIAHKFLGPFNSNTAVTTEEALNEREIAKRGHDGTGQDVKIDIKVRCLVQCCVDVACNRQLVMCCESVV